MSRPAKRISPEVGFSNPTSRRPIVVLPQPDSPTRPKVSPFAIEKDTSETALTLPIRRCRIAPAVTGNSLTRWRSSTSAGSGSIAGVSATGAALALISTHPLLDATRWSRRASALGAAGNWVEAGKFVAWGVSSQQRFLLVAPGCGIPAAWLEATPGGGV